MPVTLHKAFVPTTLQILGAVNGLLDKAAAFAEEKGMAESDLLSAKLADDMWSFAYQVKSCKVHSLGAIEGVRKGSFSPDLSELPTDIAGLRVLVAEAVTGLQAIEPGEMETFIGGDMEFRIGKKAFPFNAEDFLLGFSLPNFYFHATTAYDILRNQGVQIGKIDYLSRLPIRKD